MTLREHEPTGYAHEAYIHSLAEFGVPLPLPRSRGWLLKRSIPGSRACDAMGAYPLFSCSDWTRLASDLEALEEVVSVTLVADPFGNYDEALLRTTFRDLVTPFKDHYVVDLERPADAFVSRHHRYYARKARFSIEVQPVADLDAFLPEWIDLYAVLTERHGLRGIKAFSPEAFARQMRVPGMVALRATVREEVVGAHLWCVQGDVAYSHLTAMTANGYALGASYAIHSFALQHFATRTKWLNLGAGAGVGMKDAGGLARFKQGWSTGVRTAWLCGRVVQPDVYSALTAQLHPENLYFPAYRAGELA